MLGARARCARRGRRRLAVFCLCLDWLRLSAGAPAAEDDPQHDADCESPYWVRVQAILAGEGPSVSRRLARDGGPTNATLSRLAGQEATLEFASESAGCEVGRFLLSIWHLVRASADERVWNLKRHFGVGFYAFAWQPRPRWPVFRALARLRARALEDPPQSYSVSECKASGGSSASAAAAEDELLMSLQADSASESSGLAAASRLLLHSEPLLACPLSIASAFWALARSMLRSGGESCSNLGEGMRLLRLGEEAAKSWQSDKLPFLDLLLGPWPLWDLMARIERACALTGHGASPDAPARVSVRPEFPHGSRRDPREPRCRRPSRAWAVEGLEDQRVEAIVVYGRRERVEILNRYLLRNLRINGGVLDRVLFVVFYATNEDLVYLAELVAQYAPVYAIPQVTGRRLAKIYSVCDDPDTIYVKIDDDMVFLADETIPNMVRERRRNRCGLVSANVINHAILSAVHQDVGAIRHFYPPQPEAAEPAQRSTVNWRETSWIVADDLLPMSVITKQAQSQCVWALWECAAWMHESFLSRLADGTDCAYDFGWHDFHAHGYGQYKGDSDKFVPLPYTRWSINMFAFKMEDVAEASQPDLAADDEAELSVMVPHRMGKRACAIGNAPAVHFSYSRQEDGLLENTDLLARYDILSLELLDAEVVPPSW